MRSQECCVVASSGNDGRQFWFILAGIYNKTVIGVGSTNIMNVRSIFTNFGTNAVFYRLAPEKA